MDLQQAQGTHSFDLRLALRLARRVSIKLLAALKRSKRVGRLDVGARNRSSGGAWQGHRLVTVLDCNSLANRDRHHFRTMLVSVFSGPR